MPPHAVVCVAADGWSAADLRTMVGNVALPPVPEGTRRWWFVDEVTGVVGDWAPQVKWLRDNDPDFAEATVVLTGSNAEKLTAAAGVLAGRRGSGSGLDRTVLPIGFRTFAGLVLTDAPDASRVALSGLRDREACAALLPWLDDLVRAWELYLSYGGFPVAVAAARAGAPIPGWFVEDMFNVVFRDTFATSRLSVTTTMALLARIAEGIGAPANLNAVARDVGLTQDVVTRHVGYLRNAYLLWHCPQKADRTWTARLRAQDKLYTVDPLVSRLPHLRNPAYGGPDPTVVTEMQIGMCLHRAASAAGIPWADDQLLFYVRTPARKEIDFVGQPLTGVALESKYTERGVWRGEAATVEASAWDGILITRNVLDCTGEGAWAVPAGLFAYLVDT